MKPTKKDRARPSHRLFVQVRDKSQPIVRDSAGIDHIPVKWEEVREIDLGSIKIPNKEVFQIRFEPIEYEDEEDNDRPDFRKFFRGFGGYP
jgi:hypothetical protein